MKADIRNLKYAILGLLNRQSMSGYTISKEFSDMELNEFWSAKHSQIYPELKKLENEGLVVYMIEISGETLERKVYSITEKGKEDYYEWLNRDEEIEKTPKDKFRLRMYFANEMDNDTRCRLIESQLRQHQERKKQLEKSMQHYLNYIPPKSSVEFGDYLVMKSAIFREEATIKWLNYCLDLCKD